MALLSGGLDSTLAVRVILDQDVEVHALTYRCPMERRCIFRGGDPVSPMGEGELAKLRIWGDCLHAPPAG